MSALTILDLYPGHLNVNGDGGNVLALSRRLDWAGHSAEVVQAEPATNWWSTKPDIVHLGGGTIAAQRAILGDLVAAGDQLRQWASDGVSILGVAGGFHLLLDDIQFPGANTAVPALGLLGGSSVPSDSRISEYVVTEADGELVHGYVNSGQLVYLASGTTPWARVLSGVGNRTATGTEGAVAGSVLGTSLNGPLLPRNPVVADALLHRASRRKNFEYITTMRHAYADEVARQASAVIRERLGTGTRTATATQDVRWAAPAESTGDTR